MLSPEPEEVFVQVPQQRQHVRNNVRVTQQTAQATADTSVAVPPASRGQRHSQVNLAPTTASNQFARAPTAPTNILNLDDPESTEDPRTVAAREKLALALGRQSAPKFFVEVSPGPPAILCAAPTCSQFCQPGSYRITLKQPRRKDSKSNLGLSGSVEC